MLDDQTLNPTPAAAQAILDQSASAIPTVAPASPAVAPSVPVVAPVAPASPAVPVATPSTPMSFPTPPVVNTTPVAPVMPPMPASPAVAPASPAGGPVATPVAPATPVVPVAAPTPVVTTAGTTTTSVYEGKGMGKYKVVVIKDKCIGAASCIAVAPKTFKLDSQQIAEVISSVSQETDDNLLLAAQSCPTLAIEVYDTTTNEKVWPK